MLSTSDITIWSLSRLSLSRLINIVLLYTVKKYPVRRPLQESTEEKYDHSTRCGQVSIYLTLTVTLFVPKQEAKFYFCCNWTNCVVCNFIG